MDMEAFREFTENVLNSGGHKIMFSFAVLFVAW